MITGIPDYSSPIEQSLRCVCGAFYLIYLGGGISDAEARARGRAAGLGARFVNAATSPWLVCECGQVLEFIEVASTVGQ
jgi:hypothetical protein